MARTLNAATGFAPLFCTFLLLTFAVPVSANQGKANGHAKHPEKSEQKEDKKEDKEDKEDKKEAKAASKAHAVPSPAGTRFHELDRDNNGVITRAEWRGDHASFANHDWNHDGVLSGVERKPGAIRPATPRPVSNRTTAASTTPTPRGSGTDPDGPVFARLDANHDGVLTRAEWPDGRFSGVDFNHDGVLSPYEYGVGR